MVTLVVQLCWHCDMQPAVVGEVAWCWCAGVLALVILHAGTMCHLANTTVMTVSIISIERKCLLCVFMPLAIQWMGLEVFVFYCPSLHACMHMYVHMKICTYVCSCSGSGILCLPYFFCYCMIYIDFWHCELLSLWFDILEWIVPICYCPVCSPIRAFSNLYTK